MYSVTFSCCISGDSLLNTYPQTDCFCFTPTGIIFVKHPFFCRRSHATPNLHILFWKEFNCANKLTGENLINTTNLARWLVFTPERLAGAGRDLFPWYRVEVIGVLVIPMCGRLDHFPAPPLRSDMLIHRGSSAQTWHHAAFLNFHLLLLLRLFHFHYHDAVCLHASFHIHYQHLLTLHPAKPHTHTHTSSATFTPSETRSAHVPFVFIWENVCHFEAW